MIELKLAIVAAATNALITCTTPGPGSYYVEASRDGHAWTVLASGFFRRAVKVCVSDKIDGEMKIYRVEWREFGK